MVRPVIPIPVSVILAFSVLLGLLSFFLFSLFLFHFCLFLSLLVGNVVDSGLGLRLGFFRLNRDPGMGSGVTGVGRSCDVELSAVGLGSCFYYSQIN